MEARKLKVIIANIGIHVLETELLKWMSKTKIDEILASMTLIHETNFNKIKVVSKMTYADRVTINGRGYLRFSRFSGIFARLTRMKIEYEIINKISEGMDIDDFALFPGIDPSDNQKIIYDYLKKNIYNEQNLKNGRGSALLIMATGTGKTYMSGKMIEYFRKKTLIVVPKKSVAKEWRTMIRSFYPDLRIGFYTSQEKTDNNADVMISTVNSVNMPTWKFPGENEVSTVVYFTRFGLVIYDEIHNYATPTFGQMFWKLNNKFVIGLTATPDENAKNFDEYYYRHVGKPLIAEDVEGYSKVDIPWKLHVKAVFYHGPNKYTQKLTAENSRFTMVSKMHKQFIEDPFRNSLVISEIKRLYDKNMNIYIFAEQREFLTIFAEFIKSVLKIGVDIPELGMFMGGTTIDQQEEVGKISRIILITYKFGAEGISITKMDSIILLTCRMSKLMQIIGRIIRRGGDHTITRRIIDIVDAKTTLSKQYKSRKEIYERKECQIEEESHNWNEVKVYENFEYTASQVGN